MVPDRGRPKTERSYVFDFPSKFSLLDFDYSLGCLFFMRSTWMISMSTDLDSLILAIKKRIREIVSIHKKILENNGLENLIHVDFAEWIGL